MHLRILPSLILASVIAAGCGDQTGTPTSPRLTPTTPARNAPSTNIVPVTTTVYDADNVGNLLLTRSDDYNGTGFATHTTLGKMSSHITANGAWQLYLGSQTARTIYLVLASQGIPAPDGNYASNVEVYNACFDRNDAQVSLLLMTVGASNGNCSFGVDFSNGRIKYKLAKGPNIAGTGRAIVTCNAATSGSCTNWTIVPNPSAANTGVANLYHYTNNGSLVFDGVYHNSFFVSVAE
jgi:hypothetical protein